MTFQNTFASLKAAAAALPFFDLDDLVIPDATANSYRVEFNPTVSQGVFPNHPDDMHLVFSVNRGDNSDTAKEWVTATLVGTDGGEIKRKSLRGGLAKWASVYGWAGLLVELWGSPWISTQSVKASGSDDAAKLKTKLRNHDINHHVVGKAWLEAINKAYDLSVNTATYIDHKHSDAENGKGRDTRSGIKVPVRAGVTMFITPCGDNALTVADIKDNRFNVRIEVEGISPGDFQFLYRKLVVDPDKDPGSSVKKK